MVFSKARVTMAPIPYCFYWDLYKFGIASISHVSAHLEIEVTSSQVFSAHIKIVCNHSRRIIP